jgi:hypothetical protein
MNSFENMMRRMLGRPQKSVEVELGEGTSPSETNLPTGEDVQKTPQLERDSIVPGEKLQNGEYAPHHYPIRADQKTRVVDRGEVGENPDPSHVEVERDEEPRNVA